MTKLGIVFFIFLVAVGHRARAGSLGYHLAKADQLADTAIRNAETALTIAKATTDSLTEAIRNIFDMFIMEVRKQVTYVIDQVDNKILEFIGANKDPKVSECAGLAESIHNAADSKIVNVSKCAIEEFEKIDYFIQFIYNMTGETLAEVKVLKAELKNCTRNVSDYRQFMTVMICAQQIAIEAGGLTLKKIPRISTYIRELEAFARTLPVSLPTCVITTGILTFFDNIGNIVIGAQSCTAELIAGPSTQVPETHKLLKRYAADQRSLQLLSFLKQGKMLLV